MSDAQAKAMARQVLRSQTIGKTGYIYCLNSDGIIDSRPHAALLGTDLSGYAFIRRQKLNKVGYPVYDWIVASSSYLDELYAPLDTIGKIFVLMVFLSLLLVLPLTFWISSSITNPLGELMHRLSRGVKGDAAVRMDRDSRGANALQGIGLAQSRI